MGVYVESLGWDWCGNSNGISRIFPSAKSMNVECALMADGKEQAIAEVLQFNGTIRTAIEIACHAGGGANFRTKDSKKDVGNDQVARR